MTQIFSIEKIGRFSFQVKVGDISWEADLKSVLKNDLFESINAKNLSADKNGKIVSFTSDVFNKNLTEKSQKGAFYKVDLKFEDVNINAQDFQDNIDQVMFYSKEFTNTACLAENTGTFGLENSIWGQNDDFVPESCSNDGFCAKNHCEHFMVVDLLKQ